MLLNREILATGTLVKNKAPKLGELQTDREMKRNGRGSVDQIVRYDNNNTLDESIEENEPPIKRRIPVCKPHDSTRRKDMRYMPLMINNRSQRIKKTAHSREYPSKHYATKRSSPESRFDKTSQAGSTSSFSRDDKLKTDDRSERPSVTCYGCDKPGVTKPR
ncbi:hypothetical protein NPIL_118851 [Nephila pilipes]|uniref:Uncharacterized protein n=1 Tax=Nephila pilipes TaxID=299642 RepID=A0A8X6PTQ7_NEPPI|nr:hypothetical protein NPIL_118851 [Nephila pilipes]